MNGRIFTIGHGTWTLDAMVSMLRMHGISHLVDIRTSPFSAHQPEFNRQALERAADRKGYYYVYLGDSLGGRPTQADCYTNGKVDYSKIRQRDFFKRGIAQLVEQHQSGTTVCLMCAEGKPAGCHRTRLVAQALTDAGLPVEHFLPDGTIQAHAKLIAEPDSTQIGLGI